MQVCVVRGLRRRRIGGGRRRCRSRWLERRQGKHSRWQRPLDRRIGSRARASASCRQRAVRRVRAPEAAAPRRRGPSNRPRRRQACGAGAGLARAACRFEESDPIRTAAHAGRHRRHRGGGGAASAAAAGRMLRHRISSRHARARRASPNPTRTVRRGRAALRLSRHLLRVHPADSGETTCRRA